MKQLKTLTTDNASVLELKVNEFLRDNKGSDIYSITYIPELKNWIAIMVYEAKDTPKSKMTDDDWDHIAANSPPLDPGPFGFNG